MVWLTYRQHRLELGTMLIGALAVAIGLVAIVQYIAAQRVDVGVDSCSSFVTEECFAKFNEFERRTLQFRGYVLALYVYPVIVAAFLAGPIFSRDFERGTHRLVWTQGITRLRWALTKLAIVVGVAMLAALAIATVGGQARVLMFGRVDPWATFDFEGPVFVAYLVFAVALGTALGVFLRRTLLSMLASLLLFVGVRILLEWKARPNYLPAAASPAGGPNVTPVPADAWHLGVRYVYSSSGWDFPQEEFNTLMRNFRGGDLYAYLGSHDAVALSFYHPAERYWLFQSIEAAIFLGLSLVLVLMTLWIVRRRA